MAKKPPFFDRAIRAFQLASPFAMASRAENFAHCIEASLVGAHVLRDRTIEAKAVPCILVGGNMKIDPPVQLSLGLNERDVYDRLKWGDEPVQSFDTWLKSLGSMRTRLVAGNIPTIHMAIEARFQSECVIVDPTLGQLRAVYAISVPMVGVFPVEPGDPWPAFGLEDGWELQYENSPHAEYIQKKAGEYKIPTGWVDDLDSLMQLALDCNLDDDLFFAAMRASEPAEFAKVVARLNKLAKNDQLNGKRS